MKIHKKPTVTIAVCAYNEEENIIPFLNSLRNQKEIGFTLEKILVVSDGSTDNTVGNAQQIKIPQLETWKFKNRLGKSSRLNQIYASVTSDVLVQTDADVIFKHPMVLAQLISPIINNSVVCMCGGNPLPMPAKTFVERAVNTTTLMYQELRKTIKNGHNIFSADGRLLAYRKSFYQTLTIPKSMIANDAYTYFCCLAQGYLYNFVSQAMVLYRSPQNLGDHVVQNTRFRAAPKRLQVYFPAKLIAAEYEIPQKLHMQLLWKHFIQDPVAAGFIFIVNRYCQLVAYFTERQLNAKWTMAKSTKRLQIKI